jgi:4-hydroxy-tetrahydrodipicolinate synthase
MMNQHAGATLGIFAAIPCPLTPDLEVDIPVLAKLATKLASTSGIVGFLLNGHAGENSAMPDAMQQCVLNVVREAAPQAKCVVGVNAENSAQAARRAAKFESLGADALMVFPPNGWALYQERDMVVTHHRMISDATTLPLMLFQASVGAGKMAYPPATLAALCELPRVVGIKEGSWEVATYEETRRLVKSLRPDVAVYGSGDEHLMTSYVIGSEGSLVSLAAVAPGPIVSLFAAINDGDLDAARAAHERIYPLAREIYRKAPSGRANARLKTCLELIGDFPSDRMLPPCPPTPPDEIDALKAALEQAGLLHPELQSSAS